MRSAQDADSDPPTPTLSEVVHRAVEVCDPDGANDGTAALLERFQDRDEPVTAVADVAQELAEAGGATDPQDEDPQVVMTTALATYLAHRRTELQRDPETLLKMSAASEFDGHPPENVRGWLAEQAVEV